MIMEDIRDIREVIGILDLGTLLFLLLCLIIAGLITYYIVRKIKERSRLRKLALEKMSEKEKPFQEAALEALSAIDPRVYYEKGIIKEFYVEISEIIRMFLARNYAIDTFDRTSYEITLQLERVEKDFEKVKAIDEYLERCDLVKFAKERPGLNGMREARDLSIRLVKELFRQNAL